MKAKIKTHVHEAVRHGAAWFISAGISASVFCWAFIEVVKSALK